MIILNAMVSTINILLVLLMLLFQRTEQTKAGRYGFGFLILVLMMNTVLIWM